MKCWWPFLLLLVACADRTPQPVSLPLAGPWTVQQDNDSLRIAARVPGTVQTDLMRAGLLPNPWHGTLADSTLWVAERAWTYTLHFDCPAGTLEHDNQELVFHGIDTYAHIRLNGQLLDSTSNMFRSYRLPVEGLLKERDNLLEVRILPVLRVGAAARAKYGMDLPADNDTGEPKVSPYVRKAGYHFGWDFVPRTLPCGIWRPVELRAWTGPQLSAVHVRQEHRSGAVRLNIAAGVEGTARAGMVLKAYVDGTERASSTFAQGAHAFADLVVDLADTARWWPNGSGAQPMRRVRVELLERGSVLSAWERSIGIRTVELDQSTDSIGTRFTFVVNGRPLFMKGANVVPPDAYLPRAGDSAWVAMVRDMRAIGVNMLRVWGGGVYPPDAFFNACDTAGILVWQDLMFANAMYPGDTAFRSNVQAEVQQQVERLRHHPSLALWCGNNEVEVAWHNWGWQSTYGLGQAQQDLIWADHRGLFHGLIPGTIAALDDRPYVPTSPLSNWGNAKGLRHGNLHYWGVWHGDEALESFAQNVGRFVNEWGFQSYPDLDVLTANNPGEAPRTGTAFWASRQRSYKGDAAIHRVTDAYALPSATAEELVASSQWCQAHGYALAIAAQRMAEPYCMGTLFWQWNDVWPGASWSVVDHRGRHKPAYHAVASAFADTLLWLDQHQGDIRLRLRRWEPWDSMAVHLRLFHRDGRLLWQGTPMLKPGIEGLAAHRVQLPPALLAAHDPAALILFADLGPDMDPLRYQRWWTWVPPGTFEQMPERCVLRQVGAGQSELSCPLPQLAIAVVTPGNGLSRSGIPVAPDRGYRVFVPPGSTPSVTAVW